MKTAEIQRLTPSALGRIGFLRALILTLFLCDCSRSESPSVLSACLPQPPSGWKFKGKPIKENVAKAGSYALAVYEPTADNDRAQGVERIEIRITSRVDGADYDQFPFPNLTMPAGIKPTPSTPRKIAGLTAFESREVYPDHEYDMIGVFVADDLLVNVLAFPTKAQNATKDRKAWDENGASAAELLVMSVDYGTLKALRPNR